MDNNIIFIVLLLLLSGVFSATETAYSSYSKIKMKNLASSGNKTALKVLELSENYTKLISSILIGNNIVNILIATLFTLSFINFNNGTFLSTLISTVILLIFGEVTPKSIAKEIPEVFCIYVYPFISLVVFILTPINYLFDLWRKLINIFFKKPDEEALGSEEFLTLIEEAQNEGGLDKHEADLLTSAIEFNDLDVKDILTPRIDIVAIDIEDSIENIEAILRKNSYSRIPVYRGSIDNIIGILQEKDFYYEFYQHQSVNISSIMKNVYYTSPHLKISDLLKQLQQNKSHIAIVIDEYGGTEGLITMEDILEELVGEIYDEHDEVEVLFRKINNNTFLVKGDFEVKEFFEKLNLKVVEEFDFVTTSAWVIYNLNKIPRKNDSFNFENYKITVIDTDEKVVKQIRVEKINA